MRREYDAYYTDPRMVTPMLDVVGPYGRICEPCVGQGDILRHMTWKLPECQFVTNDINPRILAEYQEDARDPDAKFLKRVDWFISNPPFNQATDIMQNLWQHANIGMAMLLRITYAEPCLDRGEWLQEMSDHQRYFIPLHPRHNFRKGEINPATGKEYGGGFTTVAWFVWAKEFKWSRSNMTSPFRYITKWRD